MFRVWTYVKNLVIYTLIEALNPIESYRSNIIESYIAQLYKKPPIEVRKIGLFKRESFLSDGLITHIPY